MKPATREIIKAVLLGDETVPRAEIHDFLARLDSVTFIPKVSSGRLLTAAAAARSLGFSAVWFWKMRCADRTKSPEERNFPPCEYAPGRYRYREGDIEAYKERLRRETTSQPIHYSNLETKKHQ